MRAHLDLVTWVRDHPRIADWLLVAVLWAIAVPVTIHADVDPGQRAVGGLGWALIVAMHLPVAWRRTAPVPAVWAGLAATGVFWVLDFPDDATGPNLLILVYSLAAHAGRPRSLRHFWGVFAILNGILVAGVISDQDSLPWASVPANVVVFGTVWILGDNIRTRREYLAELEEKAARTQEQHEAEAQRAVAQERTRIARELHDVVAHSVSVMVVQAGAARRVLDSNPAQASEALATIEATGRESLTEMRRVLGVLRDDDHLAQRSPAPGLAEIPRLVQKCHDAGLSVDVEITGSVRRLATGLEMNAYRVVQESLTNCLKHAGPASAVVEIAYADDRLTVVVTDDGRGAAAETSGSGQGLVGMRERVEAYGGELRAGPRSGGGFAVHATFHTEGSV
ncbi:MAG: sensor histidine kinase [Acidimicrobiales bacterium]